MNQPEEAFLSKEEKQRFQAISGSVIYLGKVTRYGILYAVNEFTIEMPKPSKAHMAAAKHLLWFVPGRDGGFIHHIKGKGFQVDGFFGSNENWGSNPKKQFNVFIHCLHFKCPGELQGGDAAADGAVHNGGRARGRVASEEAVFCSKHDEGAEIQHAFRPCTTMHRQHLESVRGRKPDLQLASQTRGCAVLLCLGASQGGQNRHPLRVRRSANSLTSAPSTPVSTGTATCSRYSGPPALSALLVEGHKSFHGSFHRFHGSFHGFHGSFHGSFRGIFRGSNFHIPRKFSWN